MDDTDRVGGEPLSEQCLRNLDLQGRSFALHSIEWIGRECIPHAPAEALAIVFETIAEGFAREAALLRSGRVRRPQ